MPNSPNPFTRLPGSYLTVLFATALLPIDRAAAEDSVTSDFPGTTRDTVVVSGQRLSQASALAIKRNEAGIVDAIVADAIAKLPDTSVADALQRVTGVQISRDRGDSSAITIRGLTQMETLVNGREIFTAGTGRNFDFADFPAEMVAAIQVAKTSAANQIEGGIGGSIDLVTRRPLDFAGDKFAGSVRRIYSDLAEQSTPQVTALASTRWETAEAGEFGVLLTATDQRRAFREDQKMTGNPVARTNIIAGETVFVPNGTSETSSVGERRRSAAGLVLQWRPTSALELYAEGNYSEFRTRQDSQQINVLPSSTFTFVPGTAVLFPGTHDLQSITWTNAQASILSFARDTLDRNSQWATGGSWTHDALTLSTDLSYTKSVNRLFFSGPYFSAAVPQFTQDLSGDVPDTSINGVDLLNPANLAYAGVAYRTRVYNGEQGTWRLDADYRLDSAWIEALETGIRLTRRGADNQPGLIFADASVTKQQADGTLTTLNAAETPGLVTTNPYNDFFSGYGVDSIRDFAAGDLGLARSDPLALRTALGVTAAIPTSASAISLWDIEERTAAAYLMAKFHAPTLPLDGNVGLRAVTTHERVNSVVAITGGGATPINQQHTYTDWLPSANLRYRLTPDRYLRLALSKTLTRPNFDQLSPALSLTPNPIMPSLNAGFSGNPELRPIRADNIDVGLDQYFDANTALYATAFWKRVDGFITTVRAPELHEGAVYMIARPQNTDTAHVRGIEAGYQQFYRFLPGWLDGLGAQLNYTFVDSATPNGTLGEKVPLQNLSRHSYNAVAMYEKGPVSARVAYNWRDKFLSSVVNTTTAGAFPIYTKGYGWLDASIHYRCGGGVTLFVEGTNLLHTMRSAYFGSETRPQSSWINDRQISIGAAVELP